MHPLSTRARVSTFFLAAGVLVASSLVVASPAAAAPVGNYADLQTAFNATGTVELTGSISSPASELVLADGATQVLNLGAFNLSVHSIQVGIGSSLTITGTSGVLTADASDLSDLGAYTDARAGIYVPETGTLLISSGTVNAYGGGQGAAGIGDQGHGASGGPGDVTISGGTVTAVGSILGAGIGGSAVLPAGAGTVVISGGTVNATAGDRAAGIGGGWLSHLTSITISGGTVTATGAGDGAGIGGGTDGGGAGAISISGGSITATTPNDGAAIGSGGFFGGGGVNGSGSIDITGGTVIATLDTIDSYGAAIGAGYNNLPIPINISGATITATSDNGAGIGGGYGQSNGPIVIDSGTFTVQSGMGAGIGSGAFANADSITINGGAFAVTANGGAAIGGGLIGSATSTLLNGGTFTLVSDTNAAAIGSGAGGGAGGTIVIADGVVVSVWSDQPTNVVGGFNGSASITINGRLTVLEGYITAPAVGGGLTIGSTGVLRGAGVLQGVAPVINNGSITGTVNVTATDVQVNNFLVTYTADPSVGYGGGTQRVYAANFSNAELGLVDPVAGYDVQWFDAPVAGTQFTTLTTLASDITLYPAFSASALAATGIESGAVLPIGGAALLLGLLFVLRRRSAAAHTITE